MAIKDLFAKQKQQNVEFRGANKKSVDEFRADVESGAEIKQIRIEDSLVIPDLNYASASSFVKYGSAKKYYEDAIQRIHSQYPYDGSNAEKIEFKNNLTQLERYILDNEYPKTTGYALFSPTGWGTNTGPVFDGGFGKPDTPEYIQFKSYIKDNVFKVDEGREGNLHLNWSSGSTIEFWMKKDGFPNFATQTEDEAIFQISGGLGDGSAGHELSLYIRKGFADNAFSLTYGTYSGATYTGKFGANIVLNSLTTFADSTWHHYAIAFKLTTSTNVQIKTYVDGKFDTEDNATVSAMPTAISGSLIGTVGALGNSNAGTFGTIGYGKLSGSLDDFRFWKEQRNGRDIGRNYFRTINGGTNTDNSKYNTDNPVNLGIYFKFNEGITGETAKDSVVLDYSGRVSNGAWTGYSTDSRNTGSAITLSSAGTESLDPIIYSTHPDVVTLSTNLEASGTQHDAENVASLQNSVPLWMLDEDVSSGNNLANLLQIMGSYLDSLYLQVSQIPKFHEAEYQDNNNVAANPHNRRLLTSLGFDVPELFIDNDVLKTIANQDDKRKFEDKLNEIKNLIYKNIYNNLTFINKSKGTVKSVRNLLRCYGIDDDLFNFNVYADNAQYFLEDDFKNSSIKFDSLDLTPFANTQNTEGVIYNFAETGNTNSSPYISGSTNDQLGFTLETNAIFPKTPPTYQDSINLTSPAIVTASICGIRSAASASNTEILSPDIANFSMRVVKVDDTAKFQLSSSIGSGFLLESDRFYDVYDNSRWNLSVRVKYSKNPFNDFAPGTYDVEFNGYNYIQDIQQNSFALTSSLSSGDGEAFVDSNKRIYAGAERASVTGTLTHRANMKLLSVLAWADYLEDAEVISHARDATSFGRNRPYKNSFVQQGSLDTIYIPRSDTLAMHLAFNNVTSSNGSGEFVVPDLSSGSIGLTTRYSPDNYSKIVGIQNTAQGSQFPASSDVKDIQYLNISTQQIPENLNTENMIQVLETDDDLFFLDNRPIKFFFSLEASMYDTISREMLKTFAGVLDYGSMVGSPVVDYQTDNRELRLARDNFFERVENNPDLQKYVSLYKFLDSAIESVLANLIPASANSSDRVRTVIESHIYERSSVTRPLPPGKKIDPGTKQNNKEFDYGPYDSAGGGLANNYYQTTDTGRPEDPVGTAVFDLITKSAAFETVANYEVEKRELPALRIPKTDQAARKAQQYLNRYANKRFADADDSTGLNSWFKVQAKRTEAGLASATTGAQLTRNSIHSALRRSKALERSRAARISGEVLVSQVEMEEATTRDGTIIGPITQREDASNIVTLTKANGAALPSDLVTSFVNYDVAVSASTSDVSDLSLDANNLRINFPNDSAGFFFGASSASINGHQVDTYYDLEAPLQGPFTDQHVGGYKHRHTEVGQTDDRPEFYKIHVKDTSTVLIHSPRITDPGGTPTYNAAIPRVKFSREELIKRVYNTKNIKNSTSSLVLGNFDRNYEVINLNGRDENNFAFVQQGGFAVTQSESTVVTGVLDFALPTRSLSDGTFNKTVIVNRFSAPGEVATLSPGYLDVDSGEYSPYNALPFRNLDAVDNLNTFLSIPSAFGGFESGSTVTASFHKTPRNRVDRIKVASGGSTFTGSFFDNGFYSYQIPKKEFGYLWISSSAIPSLSMDGLYGFSTSSDGVTYLSASEVGSYFTTAFGGLRIYPVPEGESASVTGPSAFIPDNFVGLNYHIYEPIDSDTNTLGHPAGTPYWASAPSASYQNTAFVAALLASREAALFNGLINKRNGPYTYPTWKQIRTGEHPVARFLNKNSFLLADPNGGLRTKHPPVSTKYKPVVHLLKSRERAGEDIIEKELILNYPFGSEFDFYGDHYDYINNKIANPFPNKNFNSVDKKGSLLHNISGLYTGDTVRTKVNTIKLNALFYKETVWPKETNAYLTKTRDRTNFSFNWRDTATNRANQITGSQAVGGAVDYSLWPMDNNNTAVGELMNTKTSDPFDSPATTTDLNVRFGRYSLSGSGGYIPATASSPQNTVHFGTDDSANQGPFDDTYADWNFEIRTIAKDHAIIPEYRISDHIGNIIDAGFDATNNLYQVLSLTGSQATESNSRFLEDYVHSDNIPAIEIVRDTQNKDADRISINLSAVKKLLPYEGFYPSERTLQLSTLFSQSLGPTATIAGIERSFQTLNNVVFSRLTYGSIRAGVATDSANWISGTIYNPADPAEINPTADNLKWNRIPFEAIIDPASNINNTSSIIENDFENQKNSTASIGTVDTKYSLAASNFYAGVVDTFIAGSNLTTVKSKPQTEWTFTNSGFNNYSMDIVISKDDNFTNHDDPGANGFPYVTHACFYQALSSSVENYWDDTAQLSNSTRVGYYPPDASWSSNEAYVTINFDYNQFKSIVTDREPTLNDILFYSTKTFRNKQISLTTELATYATSSINASSPFMTIEAGVDLFANDPSTNQWTPKTRWECPTHNFIGTTTVYPDGTSGGAGDTAGDANRGIWHQYSTNTKSGLKMFVRGPETETARTTGSLAQACGFEIEQKTISQLATSATLKEYLVVIPFVTNECEEEVFFHYTIDEFERAYAKIGQERVGSLTEMLTSMRELILPVKLNFMDKRDSVGRRIEQDGYKPILPPFAMYIFEVSQELTQEDLSKWWQGVLPSVGKNASFENFNISHDIKAGEIISRQTLNNDMFGGKLPKEMRFKVFKAKSRSNLNYEQLKERTMGIEPVKSVLGYNYPADYYSLIEMAKVDLGLEYRGEREDEE